MCEISYILNGSWFADKVENAWKSTGMYLFCWDRF